jgi:hypothetical protein
MKKLSLLSLTKVVRTERLKGSSKFFSIKTPTPNRQQERLGPKFSKLRQTLEQQSSSMTMSAEMSGIVPERTLVFELAQAQQGFKKHAEKLGLQWLDEEAATFESDEDFGAKKGADADDDKISPSKLIEGRMYLTSPNLQSLHELVRLWDLYQESRLPKAHKHWTDFFSHLRDIRPWGPRDRLPPSTIDFLVAAEQKDEKFLRLEIEAIYFNDTNRNKSAQNKLVETLNKLNGKILDRVTIDEIRYHALLVELPSAEIQSLLNFESALLKIDEIGYVRPQALCQSLPIEKPFAVDDEYVPDEPGELGHPVAALFDAIPVANHDLLAGRLIIYDPLKLSETSPVATRRHGTAMASLIMHGDLSEQAAPLSRKLYVHCLLGASSSSNLEVTSKDHLLLGLVNRAVKDLMESNLIGKPNNVFLVNISLGDSNRPFTGVMSAWAKLLDVLAWKYRLLFIVSSGNISRPLTVPNVFAPAALNAMTKLAKRTGFIQALEASAALRTMFSPAESINALTVGAGHSDSGVDVANPYLIDPFESRHFPAVISGVGLGYRRSVKPDILHAGGKALCTYAMTGGQLMLSPGQAGKYFGQQVAHSANSAARTKIIGTSNAAALVTRGGVQIYDALVEYSKTNPELLPLLDREFAPCVVKALLVHSAAWNEGGGAFESTLSPQGGKQWKSRRTNVTRFLGFGHIDISRVTTCAPHRATLLAIGEIGADDADIFDFPLPPSLSAGKEIRKLIVTMAWISPTRVVDQAYRTATLDLVPERKQGYPIGVARVSSSQPPSDLSRKGTVVHEIFEGSAAVPITDGDTLKLRVECRSIGEKVTPKIQYAIAVTFEVSENSKIDVYQEVSSRIRLKTSSRTRVR